jgi:hypothetical protein
MAGACPHPIAIATSSIPTPFMRKVEDVPHVCLPHWVKIVSNSLLLGNLPFAQARYELFSPFFGGVQASKVRCAII